MDKTMEQLIEYHLQLKLTNLVETWLKLLEQKGVSPDMAVVQTLKQAVTLTAMANQPQPQTDLATAATILLDDYQQDSDLTAFTRLDGEAFYA